MKYGITAILLVCAALWGQKPRSVMDGVYTVEQAGRGLDTYAAKCAMCHGGDMQGGQEAPALAGAEFLFSWGGKTAGALYNYMRSTMPPTEQGTLSDGRYTDILAAIFQKNEFPAGKTELPADAKTLGEIAIPKEKP
jgi:mono/diheme cytochrome c family protein